MAFIKAQKIVVDENNQIISGSAAIVDTIYGDYGSYHAKHKVRERLGKVLSLSEDKKRGIFLSPTRGLVAYDALTDAFTELDKADLPALAQEKFPETEVHTVFGDTYLLLKFLEKIGLMSVLRHVFLKDKEFEQVLCHLLHGVLKDGSKISCDDFISKSFASYIVPDVILSTLRTDSRYFTRMGEDAVKLAFFRGFIADRRKQDPDFGRGCYVDSTPLPNDIYNNPFNALCCHGINSSEVMSRLIVVLDEKTGLPVWFDFIPGNLLDLSTVMTVVNDVADSLDIEIESLVLDAGYVSKELIASFHIGSEKTLISRMPKRKGYPYKTLYWQIKPELGHGKYDFVRGGRAYFGQRKKIELFGQKEYAYIYVDKATALTRYSTYLTDHESDFQKLKNKDKDWLAVKYGFFVLISNIDTTPEEMLSQYFGRTEIETAFKTSKEYLDLLPLKKWTDSTVRGKILQDMISTITLLLLRKSLKKATVSTSKIFGKTQSLMCVRNHSGMITVETPNKQVKSYYAQLGIQVPAHVRINDFMEKELGLKV